MASTVNVIRAIWLDPFSPLAESDKAQLRLAGIDAASVNTLGELNLALSRAHVVVVRLAQSAELMHEVQTLIAQLGSLVPVVCRVDRQDMDVVVDAMRSGALHVVPCDEWNVSSWQQVVWMLRSLSPASKNKSYVFVDPVSQHLLALAQRVAQANVSTLLVGPTGAGKEVIARVLHESSGRAKGPFIAMNCAAMPEHLIEDMLFGHEKGAFTGAVKDYKGIFEQAQGGTVFLDEIGEMPMHLQAKLLRVLQERKITRLGGEAAVSVDVRVVAATNKDLRQAIDAREFREDLYFRISTFRLRIQPLKDRPGDIVPLVAQSLARHVKGGVPFTVTPEAQVLLQNYPWPGNVRELENVVQRAVVLSGGRTISPAHLMFDDAQMDEQAMPAMSAALPQAPVVDMPVAVAPVAPVMPAVVTPAYYAPVSAYNPAPMAPIEMREEPAAPINLDSAVKASELQVIMAAIQSTDSRMEAAAKLGISPRTLRYKLAQMRTRGMTEGASA